MRKAGFILILFWASARMNVFAQTDRYEAIAQGLRFQAQADSVHRLNDAAQAAALQKTANEWFARAVALEETPVASTTSNTETMDQETESAANEEPEENRETKIVRASEFAILSKSPYSTANPPPVNVPLPDGVAYKIQLGAFSKQLPANAFKGLTPISGEKLSNGVTKYFAGLFRRFTDADDALRKVREYGFKDAFIVAFFNQKTISTERARQLEENTR